MITGLGIQHFKSWKNTGKLQLAPLTGFFGANSSGKTSILQSLLMLKQTVECPHDWNGVVDLGDVNSIVNLGSIDDLIYLHKPDSKLGIYLSWKLSEKLSFIDKMETDTFSYEFSIRNLQNSVTDLQFNYKTNEINYGIYCNAARSYSAIIEGDGLGSVIPYRCYGIMDARVETLQKFTPLQTQFENLFRSICYLGPLREYPRDNYAWQGKHTPGVWQKGRGYGCCSLFRSNTTTFNRRGSTQMVRTFGSDRFIPS